MADWQAVSRNASTQTRSQIHPAQRGMVVTVAVTITTVVPLVSHPIRVTIVTRRWVPFIETIYEASGIAQAADGTLVLARVPIH